MADILYISDSSIPSFSANSIHVMKMCQAFALHGHRVTLLGKNTRACQRNVNDVYAFYGVDRIFEIGIFPSRPFSGSGRWYNLVLPFLMRGRWSLRYTRSVYAAWWCVLLGERIVLEVHEPFEGKGFFLSRIFSRLMRSNKVIRVVVISGALRDYLIKSYKLDESRIILAHDGADPAECCDGIALPGANRFKAGYVGSLLRGKGAELLVPLSKLCPSVDFHLVGGKPEEVARLSEQADPGQQNLFLHGFVEHSKTLQYLRSFDVLLAPYQDGVYVKESTKANNIARWMSPLKLFEYMSVGKPIIASDLPVLREVVEHLEDAILCKGDDPHAWKEAITEVARDSDIRERLGSNAQKKFLAHYTWFQRAGHILKAVGL